MPALPAGTGADRLARARAYLQAARGQLESIHRAGASGLSVCRLVAEATDRLVVGLWQELSAELSAPRRIALVGLGGYGRRELAFHSDLDLVLLRGSSVDEADVASLAEAFSTLLWDLKLQVGWSVRSPAECGRAAEDDHTIRTALLDARCLAGDRRVFRTLDEEVLRELLLHRADAFIADKCGELAQRRERFGESIYLLEPNVKQGEGGLRDLEAALWIAHARFRTRGLSGLLKQSLLPASEVATVRSARDFLLRVRNELHRLRGRKEDRLTFDLQEEVAANLGYRPSEAGLPVEQFMRHYYLSAKAIRRAADGLISRCEEAAALKLPPPPERRLPPFKVFRGRLTLEGGSEQLSASPALLLRLFRVAEEENLPLHSWARDQVTLALPALALANGEGEVVDELKALFSRPGTRGRSLQEMHELGVLGAVLPEFGRITAHHQHDLYHVYTVDIHSLFAVRRLMALRAGDLLEEEPALTREMQELSDPLPLYLGMLLHDCGKGLGGDHSRRGEALAEEIAVRLRLSERQRTILCFLVRSHLWMSHTAQRRDLSDPALIAEFARTCRDLETLTCLYLLTYADICSVGPNLWTKWKARLLSELFQKARAHLLGSASAEEASAARKSFLERWAAVLGEAQAEELSRTLPERYFTSADPDRAVLHGRLLARTARFPVAAFLRASTGAGAPGISELSICAPDRPGLLAILAGVLSAHRIDILRARILSTRDGRALDIFEVQAPQGRPLDRARWRAARADLLRILQGETSVEEVLRRRRTTALLARPLPRIETRITVDNKASQGFTVIDVRAQDRVGLLYAIASALSASGLEISLAKVATEAHRAIDSFYVSRGGRKLASAEEISAVVESVRARIDTLDPLSA